MDGVEIEAYGHLFDQFWSPATNHRSDEYGGSFENRMRFPLRVLRAIRERVGPDYIVGIRMAVDERLEDGIDTPVGLEILRRLSSEQLIDFVNVIRGTIVNDAVLSEVIPIHGMRSAPHLDFAGMVRAETELPVLHASKIDDVATARHAISEGLVDMVGMTRAQMAEPHLVRKIQLGVGAHDQAVRGGDVLPRPHLSGRRGVVHPQRGDRSRADDAARHTSHHPSSTCRHHRWRPGWPRGGTSVRRARARRGAARSHAVDGWPDPLGGAQPETQGPVGNRRVARQRVGTPGRRRAGRHVCRRTCRR